MEPRPGRMLGTYRLKERLGEGGMGAVWRAADTRLQRDVAVKILPETWASSRDRFERFEAEARAVASLDHPNIVTIHAIETADGIPFFTMELVSGRTLDQVVGARGLPLELLLDLAIPTCDALAAAHARGITHRDLKPANIMVTEQGAVKILDFGLAQMRSPEAASDLDSTVSLDQPAVVSGTLLYMSPEQLRGQPVDMRSDLFTLGVVLYEMATGRRPFGGTSAPEIAASILRDIPAPVTDLRPHLPARLARLVAQCLEKDPQNRPAGAGLVRDLLRSMRQIVAEDTEGAPVSIAVLPFADMSEAKDQGYFCDGVAEEILNVLTRVSGLRVASRTSSFLLRSAGLDSRAIGDRLGVRAILDGSVRKAGARLRVTVELVDAASGFQLWSQRFDRQIEDVFAIQDEIAQHVVQALEVRLSPRERRALRQVATDDVRAYDFYLRGRQYYDHFDRRGIEFALQMFRRAIEIDATYALAYAGSADCCAYLYLNVDRREAHRDCALAGSRQALELDPELAEAHASHAVALSLHERRDEAKKHYETAIRLNPRLFEAYYFYARDLFTQGEVEKAAEMYERASEVRPEDYQAPLLVAQIYDDLGLADEARSARRRGIACAESRLDLRPDDVRALYMGGNGLVALGERERGLAWTQRALDLAPEDTMLLYNAACIFSLAGDSESSLDCLEKAMRLGFAHRQWIERDSNLDSLRQHPRYRALMA